MEVFETVGYAKDQWAWKDNNSYWEMVENMPGSLLGKPIAHLKSVCWLDPYVTISEVLPGTKY